MHSNLIISSRIKPDQKIKAATAKGFYVHYFMQQNFKEDLSTLI